MSGDTPQQQTSPRDEVNSCLDGSKVATPRRITSETLMAGRRELIIEHSGEAYRLTVTSKGKLILTK